VVIVGTGIQMGGALFPALSRLMGVPVSTVSLLVSVWAFTGLLSPLFGPPSDRYGYGTFVLIGLGAFILGNLLSAVAPGFPALLVFQILVGLGYAVFSFSASALVGDVFAYETRARAMGIVRVGVSVAALAGVPAAAAIADRTTARGSFGTVGGLGLVVLAFALTLLPRLSREAAQTRPTETEGASWRTVMRVARQRSAMISLLVVLAWAAVPTGLFIYLAAWLEQTYQLTETQVGLAFAMAGVGSLIGNALTAAWADRLGKKRSAVLGLLVLSATVMLLPHSPVMVAVLIGLIVFFAALEFGFASFSTLMTELVPTGRGTLMSLVSLANGIGTGAAPLIMRPLWENQGYTLVTAVLSVVGLSVAVIVGLFVTELQASPSASSQRTPVTPN
jgi:DHA1 family inner membrane transport protein